MKTISLCMIVKNEEKLLSRCLDSIKDVVDEIIIIDTGSTDKTKKIAKKYTSKIYNFKWIFDFAKARNYSFSKASMDYIMWLDADDIITNEEKTKIKNLKEKMDGQVEIYMFKYNVGFDENNNSNFSYYRERLVKNNNTHKWIDRVHEFIPLTGKIEYIDIAIEHRKTDYGFSNRNLKIYQNMEKNNELFTPRNEYYYARELITHKKYRKAIKYLNKFLKDNLGWTEDNIAACQMLYDCHKKINSNLPVKYLYKCFEYDLPRAKTCYLIGSYFQEIQDYDKAIYWYNNALISAKHKVYGFYEKDYDKFYPLLGLVVCYDKIGEFHEAKACHDITKELNKNHPSVIHNEKYFKEVV